MGNIDRFTGLRTFQFTGFAETPSEELIEIFKVRKRQFVDVLQWPLPIVGSALEVDQFDNENAVYCRAKRDGKTVFSVRMLAREHSMVAALWPDLLQHIPANYTEISRLCLHDPSVDPEWKRAVAPMLVTLAAPFFAVADRRITLLYASLGIKPDEKIPFADFYLCLWHK
ncbi:hypothetical protein RCCWILLIS_81 [Rhodobacter phage RcCWillis]|nr:hypothetical protein RCCWILLIS_81 [Rhodobacter phage RcCWillis]